MDEKKNWKLSSHIIASFHPAFLMRQPDQKKLAWIDLKLIREKMKQLNF
jgi:uracil-DNA glycosylase